MKDDHRLCDVCGSVIPKGEKYRVVVLAAEKVRLLEEMWDAEPDQDLVPTRIIDAAGNIQMEICLDCHMNMGVAASEYVN